jgi:hypothetical protein
MNWSKEEDGRLRELYADHTRKEISGMIGRTEGAVRTRCYVLGLRSKDNPDWTQEEIDFLVKFYQDHEGKEIDLNQLSAHFGRTRWGVAMKASKLGLGNYSRKSVEQWKDRRKFKGDNEAARKSISDQTRERLARDGHPKGFLGGHHTEKAKRSIGDKARAFMLSQSKKQIRAMRKKARETNMQRYGCYSPVSKSTNAYSRAKGGKREDLENRYFRSAWEANYARYLNWLKAQGEIKDWQYEVDTFYFEGVRRGALSYMPDFKIFENDGRVLYHEVKGWMDSKSKTKLKRMKKYYPDIEVIVIGEKEYRAVAKYSALIPNWESDRHAW